MSDARFRFRFSTYRGSPSNGSPPGIKISQNMRATARCSVDRQGSSWKVSGSGSATISLSSMRAKPSIEEPSKPIPSSRAPSNSSAVMAKFFNIPRISVNHSRMNLISCSLAFLSTYSLPSSLFPFAIFTSFIYWLLIRLRFRRAGCLPRCLPNCSTLSWGRT